MIGEADSMTDELLAMLHSAGIYSRGDLQGRLFALFQVADCWIAAIAARDNKASWQSGHAMYLEAVKLRADLQILRPSDPEDFPA